MVKINYLILAHNNFKHIDRMIKSLDGEGVNFFIHINKRNKYNYTHSAKNVYILKDRILVNWGGYGIANAILSLIKHSFLKSPANYYVSLSGSCYPIKSNRYIKEVFSKEYEFINIEKVPSSHKPLSRFLYYHLDYDRRRKDTVGAFYKLLEKLIKSLRGKRKIPFQIYSGAPWFALTHVCVAGIIKSIEENRNYEKFFKNTCIPDEAFFQTVVWNMKLDLKIKESLTFTDWTKGGWHPAIINEKHLEYFKINKSKLFARKFSENSEHLLDIIDNEIRKND